MANLAEILAKEQNRTDTAVCYVAYLYREGSFMRAYEWSAWLYVKIYSEMKVTTWQVKSLGKVMAFVGFPHTSMEKYTPKGAQVVPEADGSVKVILPAEEVPTDLQGMKGEFETWKGSLPVEDAQLKVRERREVPFDVPQSATASRPDGVFSILQRIMSYPLENATPAENIQFISKLKHSVSSLL